MEWRGNIDLSEWGGGMFAPVQMLVNGSIAAMMMNMFGGDDCIVITISAIPIVTVMILEEDNHSFFVLYSVAR